jgi:hypothetical protein
MLSEVRTVEPESTCSNDFEESREWTMSYSDGEWFFLTLLQNGFNLQATSIETSFFCHELS